MIEVLNNLDTQLFYLVNHHNCAAMDWVMWFFSARWSWAIIIVAAFCLTTVRFEAKRWWLVLLAIGLCFLLADQGSVQLFKNTVCRLRPCHALPDVHMFREGCGGQYGFISSHAANAFAIAVFILLKYWKRDRVVPLCMMAWAVLTCYSRVYLGKHYPGDLLCGALFGVLVAFVVHYVTLWTEKKLAKNETKK